MQLSLFALPTPDPATPQLKASELPPFHICWAPDCTVPISLSMLMCPRHWRQVPKPLQQQVWEHYRPGQEEDGKTSQGYRKAAWAAIAAVTGAQNPAPQPAAIAQLQAVQTIEQPHSDAGRPPPGTRCTLRPLLDSQGRTRPTWAGQVLTIQGYHPQGLALLDVGTSHPYPASLDRIELAP
jgi:hypothetical protein